MPEISDDDFGLLCICASLYGSRLRYGLLPARIWEQLTPVWQQRFLAVQEDPDG